MKPPRRRRGRVLLEGEAFYQIADHDHLRPFFMTIVSPDDHWMFIWSNGGLTAGRGNPDLALFPYYTDDKIRDMAGVTGSKTILRTGRSGRQAVWEPFTRSQFRIRRNLYKSFRGNKIILEENNEDLGLTFRCGWFNSNRFGFIKRAWLSNSGTAPARISLVDGLQNVMPCGTTSQFNLEYSTLLDAYKRSEWISETGLALFRLSAIPVDRPEPAESPRTNVVWSNGLKPQCHLLSSVQLDAFRDGLPLSPETDVRGERGAYFVHSILKLNAGQTVDWMFVADVNQGPSEVASLNEWLIHPESPHRLQTTIHPGDGKGSVLSRRSSVLSDIESGSRELDRIVASADGLQNSAHPLANARHYSNTLFNVMRGGVFKDGYNLDPSDLHTFVAKANKEVAARHKDFFQHLPQPCLYPVMVAAAAETGDPQLERICREYLPLTFSRRHGDPSRPWNRFSIATRNPDGSRILDYQGNWRDIFQNWEALAISFPGFVSGMICRFVNASTADGYNPYRITRDGIDWEVLDPHDPWSYIGYWGDHQIIYLLRLLEILETHDPSKLHGFLTRDIFSFANVPYRIKPYEHLLSDPKSTVVFDRELHDSIQRRVTEQGADAKLLCDGAGEVLLVNLTEKLLIPILAKLSNFIPGAGIWLNTQRPEWNDANNALVGNGASMVTLYYLRRHLTFCRNLFSGKREDGERDAFSVSREVAEFLESIATALKKHARLLKKSITDGDRRRVLDDLGHAGGRYRESIYNQGFSGRKSCLTAEELTGFFDSALIWIDHSIGSNRRSEGLFHSYNLVSLNGTGKIPIRRLYSMLEGQVAVLSSGYLSPRQSLDVLTALRRSALYRPDQHSYLLYPDRHLPHFIEKNNIPAREVLRSNLLRRLLTDGNLQLIERDVTGKVHFNPGIKNVNDVEKILDQIARRSPAPGIAGAGPAPYRGLVDAERSMILAIYERLFDHQSFTGRSGTFFGYEGLGCIYWHMVSKLLVAAGECLARAAEAGASKRIMCGLASRYHDVRAGLGDFKTPEVYGAFPIDPYSHTPGNAGARQPGLTGQVKEDILSRFGELGVRVRDGQIEFRPRLLRREEFLKRAAQFTYLDVSGRSRSIEVPNNSLVFTCCQTPIIYELDDDAGISVRFQSGGEEQIKGTTLNKHLSSLILNRAGAIKDVFVHVQERGF
jgi:hypothetical protein